MRQALVIGIAVLVLAAWPSGQAGRHPFALGAGDFLLDGKPFQIIAGELHPARIPAEYWRHRVRMAKAMGCNTIAAYIFWNYHEPTEGTFDFSTANRDVARFIRLVQEEGMWLLLRPGPYVSAEWDFGGLPPYLLRHPDLRVRCMHPRYMVAAEGSRLGERPQSRPLLGHRPAEAPLLSGALAEDRRERGCGVRSAQDRRVAASG